MSKSKSKSKSMVFASYVELFIYWDRNVFRLNLRRETRWFYPFWKITAGSKVKAHFTTLFLTVYCRPLSSIAGPLPSITVHCRPLSSITIPLPSTSCPLPAHHRFTTVHYRPLLVHYRPLPSITGPLPSIIVHYRPLLFHCRPHPVHYWPITGHPMGPKSHTKFERNPPNHLRDLENEFARAHVQMHSISDMWKALI